MNPTIKEHIRFVLEDDNELISAALDKYSDLDEENKRLNRELIKKHEQILKKLDNSELLNQEDLQLVHDANVINVIDEENLNGRHAEAVKLNEWLDTMTELNKDEAMKILEEYLDRDSHTPAKVYRALYTLWKEATPNDFYPAFDNKSECLKCGRKVSFADVTDTLVFVGDEIIKRHDGDITNRNCVRCNYPKQYPDYEDFDVGGDE